MAVDAKAQSAGMKLERRPRPVWLLGLAVFGVVFSFRMFFAMLWKPDFTDEGCEVERIAISLSMAGVFGDPYQIPTGPTTHSPPFYPFLLGLIYKVMGSGLAGQVVRQAMCCATTAAQYALLPAVACRAGLSRRAGVLAGLLGGLLSLRYWVETKCTFGEPYVALALVLLTWLFFWRAARPSRIRLVIDGLAWGIAVLVSPTLVLAFFGFAVIEWWFTKERFGRWAATAALRLIVVVAVLAPWSIRNYTVFHRPIFVRGNLGLELAVANHDTATPKHDENQRTAYVLATHPLPSLEAARQVLELGEPEYNRRLLRESMTWIRDHPRQFARLTILRIREFWFPSPSSASASGLLRAFVTWVLTIAGLAAWIAIRRIHPAAAGVLGAIWFCYPPIYYLVAFDERYRYPLEWTFYLLVGYVLSSALVSATRRVGERAMRAA